MIKKCIKRKTTYKDLSDIENNIDDLMFMLSESALPESVVDLVFDEDNLNESYGNPDVSGFFSRVVSQYKKPGDIFRLLEKRRKKYGQNVNDLRYLGHAAYRQKNYKFAIDLFKRCVKEEVCGSYDFMCFATCLRMTGDLHGALSVLQIHERNYSSDHDSLFEKGIVLFLLRRLDECLELTSKLVDEVKGKSFKKNNLLKWLHVYLMGLLGKDFSGFKKQDQALLKRYSNLDKAAANDVLIGVLDYKGPDFSSCSMNIGDTMQSVAMLRQLAKFWKPDCNASDSDLEQSMSKLNETWPVEKNLDCQSFGLCVLDRDYGYSASQLMNKFGKEKPIWIVYYGWFLHKHFGRQLALPLSDNVRPVFVSFYLQRPDDLTDELITYLKRYEPIGCRDWDTAYVLLNQGVKAFFSGCITTTLQWDSQLTNAIEQLDVDYDSGITDGATNQKNNISQYRVMGFNEAVNVCLMHLDQYKSAKHISTSRLHCYLPSKAIGADVEFYPGDLSDRRFSGLYPASDDELLNISSKLNRLLDLVYRMLLSGASEQDIYSAWRSNTAPLVKDAVAHMNMEPVDMFGSAINERQGADAFRFDKLSNNLYTLGSGQAGENDAIWIILSFDDNLTRYLSVLIRSILENTETQVNFALLVRGVQRRRIENIAERFPECCFKCFEMDGLLDGIEIGLAPLTTISTMDRIFIPQLLPDIDRIIYLDIDTIVLGDVAELISYTPSERGISARPTPNHSWPYQFNVLNRRSMGYEVSKAREYRRLGAKTTDLKAPYFNAGVLVLSLEKLRELDFTNIAIRMTEKYGIEDQEILNLFAKGDYTHLPSDWNLNPRLEYLHNPKIIHWAGAVKPWINSRDVLCSEKWRRYA